MRKGPLTFVLYSPFHARLACSTKGMAAHELEILGNIIHFLPLQVCNDDEDFIATGVVHASQEHKFRQLKYV